MIHPEDIHCDVRLLAHNPSLEPQRDEVVYLEDAFCPEVNAYIRAHLTKLTYKLQRGGLRLVYVPALTTDGEAKDYFQLSEGQLTTSLLWSSMQVDHVEGRLPALLFYRREHHGGHLFEGITVDPACPERAFETLFAENEYEDVEEDMEERRCCYHIAPCSGFLTLGQVSYTVRKLETALPEPELTDDDRRILAEIEERLDKLRKKGIADSVLQCLLSTPTKPSRLVITRDYRLLLPDYDKEIVMTTGDKMLYLLLLRHPEGIRQKCLTDYVKEMEHIHLALTNGFLTVRAKHAIETTVMEEGRCNERISRIRRAFLAHIAPAVAQPYIPLSGRDQERKITLPQDLVEWEKAI